MEAHTQHPQKDNRCCGIVDRRILWPSFFENTLTGDIYFEFLQFDKIPALVALLCTLGRSRHTKWPIVFPTGLHISLCGRCSCISQWDISPLLHKLKSVVEYPARSPHLAPLAYCLWGFSKSKFYVNKPTNIDNNLKDELCTITREVIHNIQKEFTHLGYFQAVNENFNTKTVENRYKTLYLEYI